MAIKVRAVNPGVFGLYREPGVEFEIQNEKQFSRKWMEKVDADNKPVKKGKKDEDQSSDESSPSSSVI